MKIMDFMTTTVGAGGTIVIPPHLPTQTVMGCSVDAALIIGLLLASVTIKRYFSSAKQPAPYPPGPKGLPLLGNALDFPTQNVAEEYASWSGKYGSDILYGGAFGTHVIILNKRKDVDELFERRASKYSDRPYYPIIQMVGLAYSMAFMAYGEQWRLCRRLSHQAFRQAASRDYEPLIARKVNQALASLLHDPDHFEDHSKMLSISIPMVTMYGYDVKAFTDPVIEAADESIKIALALMSPGGCLMNIIPILRNIPGWLPGASSRREADRAKELADFMRETPLEFVKTQMAEGIAKPSFVSSFYEKKATLGATQEEEDAVLSIAPTTYAGASDTTRSATGTFIYLMAINPDIQKKAQAEIDHVVGKQRLPEFEDRKSMPYLEAIYREVLRWRPPVSVGVPHTTTEDDIYKGYFIPKGANVISNIWAMTHDETVYPEADAFKPERFINPDGSLNKDDQVLAFGFGRRICVGKHVASSTLWLTIASILASFDIRKKRDKLGREIEISPDYEDFGILTHKKAFECSITPRSAAARELIEQSNANA